MKDQFRKIWVEWIDSTSHSARWYHRGEVEDILETTDLRCESVGFLLDEDDEKLTLTFSLALQDDQIIQTHGVHMIPIVAITDWEYLE